MYFKIYFKIYFVKQKESKTVMEGKKINEKFRVFLFIVRLLRAHFFAWRSSASRSLLYFFFIS